jgi:membrane protease YdiL (CAAX protease family)
MRAIVMFGLIPVLAWVGQSLLLRRAGLPVRMRLSARDLPGIVKQWNRAVLYVGVAAVLLGYPVLRGTTPAAYYAQCFPVGPPVRQLLWGVAASTLYLVLLYLAWLITDNIRLEVRHGARRLAQRLAGVPLLAAGVAFVEELLFRGVLLRDLMDSMPAAGALVLASVIFALAHYVRAVKRYWTFPGHLALGGLLCVAYWRTGALWLPIGLHAGGILILAGIRPFIRYVGPAWLVGASIFPYAGLVGLVALGLLTAHVWIRFGGTP